MTVDQEWKSENNLQRRGNSIYVMSVSLFSLMYLKRESFSLTRFQNVGRSESRVWNHRQVQRSDAACPHKRQFASAAVRRTCECCTVQGPCLRLRSNVSQWRYLRTLYERLPMQVHSQFQRSALPELHRQLWYVFLSDHKRSRLLNLSLNYLPQYNSHILIADTAETEVGIHFNGNIFLQYKPSKQSYPDLYVR